MKTYRLITKALRAEAGDLAGAYAAWADLFARAAKDPRMLVDCGIDVVEEEEVPVTKSASCILHVDGTASPPILRGAKLTGAEIRRFSSKPERESLQLCRVNAEEPHPPVGDADVIEVDDGLYFFTVPRTAEAKA